MALNLSSITKPRSLVDGYRLPPQAWFWITGADTAYLIPMSISTVLVGIVILICLCHLYYIHYYVRNERVQCDLYHLSLLFPIYSVCSLIGMYIPRSAQFMFTVCTTYLMICIFMIAALMRDLFGSRARLSDYLLSRNQLIIFHTPPLCCCCRCKCWPRVQPTLRNLTRIERMVLQTPIVRITSEVLNAVLFFEEANERANIVLEIIESVSFMVAIYGCFIMVKLGKEKLSPYKFSTIFRIVNATQIITILQKLVFDSLVNYFPKGQLLGQMSQALFWNGFSIAVEMCFLSILTSFLLNPRRCALFEKEGRYGKKDNEKPPLATLDEDAFD